MRVFGRNQRVTEPGTGGVVSGESATGISLVLAGTVARPTATLKMEGFAGSATVPTEKLARALKRPHPPVRAPKIYASCTEVSV